MKRSMLLMSVVLAITLSVVFQNTAFGTGPEIDSVEQAGQIRGVVGSCTETALDGMLVYIPGKSFVAKTGQGGEFTLSYVPTGFYDLVFELDGNVLYTADHVQVRRGELTDVGTVTVCPEVEECTDFDDFC